MADSTAPDRPASPKPRVLAVDGNSLGHRAFHSVRAEVADDPRPLVTGAVVTMLASAWIHGPYDAVVVAFDHPVNRRKLDHPEYKANRPPSPPELARHLDELRGHLDDCGFSVLEREGAEADDLLAAVVDACATAARRCDVLSSDRDLIALVGPSTRLLRPGARFSQLMVEDEEQVRRRYGVLPSQYVDLAALRGDPSDGLEGATGIGPKTAARLLRSHGSVVALYEALSELPPRVEAALREARERVERNLVLMAPIPHLDVDADEMLARRVDHRTVASALSQVELEDAARRFVRACTAPPPPPVAPPPSAPDEPVPVAAEDRRAPREAAPAAGVQAPLF